MKLTDYYWFRRIQNAGWCIFHPRQVQSSYPTSRVFDEWMHEAMKNPNFSNPVYFAGELFSVELNGVRIWTRNYPYAYGMLYGDAVSIDRNRGALPLSITRSRLFDAIESSGILSDEIGNEDRIARMLKGERFE